MSRLAFPLRRYQALSEQIARIKGELEPLGGPVETDGRRALGDGEGRSD